MSQTISEQIKFHRKRLGWSLKELACRADTSVATLSRYENGWTRFEVGTVSKLASALECELRIELSPVVKKGKKPLSGSRLIKRLQRLFWDRTLAVTDLDEHRVWVVERVLEYGQLEDVWALQRWFGRRTFLEAVAQASNWSARTSVFWSNMLNKEGVPCMRKYLRPKPWR